MASNWHHYNTSIIFLCLGFSPFDEHDIGPDLLSNHGWKRWTYNIYTYYTGKLSLPGKYITLPYFQIFKGVGDGVSKKMEKWGRIQSSIKTFFSAYIKKQKKCENMPDKLPKLIWIMCDIINASIIKEEISVRGYFSSSAPKIRVKSNATA